MPAVLFSLQGPCSGLRGGITVVHTIYLLFCDDVKSFRCVTRIWHWEGTGKYSRLNATKNNVQSGVNKKSSALKRKNVTGLNWDEWRSLVFFTEFEPNCVFLWMKMSSSSPFVYCTGIHSKGFCPPSSTKLSLLLTWRVRVRYVHQ